MRLDTLIKRQLLEIPSLLLKVVLMFLFLPLIQTEPSYGQNKAEDKAQELEKIKEE